MEFTQTRITVDIGSALRDLSRRYAELQNDAERFVAIKVKREQISPFAIRNSSPEIYKIFQRSISAFLPTVRKHISFAT